MRAFDLGGNGITKSADAFYVSNTNIGSLIKIPIDGSGNAGTPVVVKSDCNALGGIDGIALDTNGDVLAVLNSQNRLVSIDAAGDVTVLLEGGALANPASIALATIGGKKNAVITNSSFFTMPPAPTLIAVPLE